MKNTIIHLLNTKMRLLLALFLLLAPSSFLFSQDALNMTLLAHWDDDSLPVGSPGNLNVQYSGCWGLAVNGQEYAILGGARHVLIFNITDPTLPELVGKYEGKANTVWREFKSYKNRVYGVSDATTEGLMIFDFNNAPDTIIRTYYSNEFFNSAHTITLDTVSGRIYLNGSNAANQGLLVLDISQDPDQPTVLASRALLGGYIHDSYVRNDTVYASSGFTGYFVYDYTDVDTPKVIASLPVTGYQHNNWLSADGRYAYCTEEIPSGRPILIIDLQDMGNANLEVAGSFLDPLLPAGMHNAIPHNVYIRDNLLFNSQYEDGLHVYDISNPTAPVRIAYYDTHPQNTQYNQYFGNWGSYPWLPSGTIIAGDMQNGLHLLKITGSSSTETATAAGEILVFPNPVVSDLLTIHRQETGTPAQVRLFTATGNLVRNSQWLAGTHDLQIKTSGLPAGIYLLQMGTADGAVHLRKVVVASR
ncbi:MAG: choice-of-anchor B family protein [Bacteroidetes bacterium]|nr:MAG: choice-of-anchor B family protein [Bacteroidota bacterium]